MPITRAELKSVKSLATKKGRREAGKYLAEGVRLLEEALRFNVHPDTVYYAASLLPARGLELVDQLARQRVVSKAISASDLSRIAGTPSPQGILAVLPTPNLNLGELCPADFRNILLCEDLSDPGNVGTLWRSALAFGFDLAILCGQSAEPFSPKVVRASMGAVFGLPLAVSEPQAVAAWLAGAKFTTVASSPGGRQTLAQIGEQLSDQRLMLMIGSEANGLSASLLDQSDHSVRIEHRSEVESLNSAVAGSILMKERFDAQRKNN